MDRSIMGTVTFPHKKPFVISCLSACVWFVFPLEAEIKEMNHNKGLFLAILELSEVSVREVTLVPQENTVKLAAVCLGF